MVKKIFYILSLYTVATLAGSCTKLHEQVLDETSSTGSTEKEVTEGLIAPIYAILPGLFQHTQYFALQQISTDQAILPYRGGTDWGDNGIYISLLRHETTSADPNVRNVWNNLTQGISRAILAINALPSSTDPNAPLFLAEARGMRAYYNLLCLDLFGIAFQKDDPQTNSVILRGNDAIEYIKSELLAIEPLLRDDTGPGRITKQAVWGLLAKLHLQAAVYRDIYASSFSFTADDMDKVIQYCDQIINSGKFALSPEYFEIFDDANHTNKELIFAIDQRADLNGHNRMAYFSLSGDQFPLAAYPGANGTDGPGITSDFYQTWEQAYAPNDPADMDGRFLKRNLDTTITCIPGNNFHIDRGILRGQQYGLIRTGGAFETCPNGDMKVGKLYNNTRNRPDLPVFFTEEINFSDFSNYNNGYRVEKYEFSRGSVSGRNFGEHDIVILRLADVYLMRAEAQLRKSAGNEAAALSDVNTIRAARTARIVPPPLTEMNLDLLYRERGFELYWENVRRTDMIRFGKYESTWTEKTNSDPKKRIFPIPQNAIDGASNLPGYLEQNDSY